MQHHSYFGWLAYRHWSTIPHANEYVQLYAAAFLPLLLFLLFVINVYTWHRSKINYQFIFEFDPRSVIVYHQYFEVISHFFLLLSTHNSIL